MSDNIIVALIAISPTLITLLVTTISNRKKTSLDDVEKHLKCSISELKDLVELNNKNALKRYLVLMLTRVLYEDDYLPNEYEKSIIEESYLLYRSEHGNGYVEHLYTACKDAGKL